MNGFNRKAVGAALVGLAVLWVAGLATAELADVYLKNGLKLRGDVTRTPDAIILRNAAGELRFAPADVQRIVPVPPPTEPPSTQPADADRPTVPRTEPGEAKPLELPPAPPVSKRDRNRLRLGELTIDGPPENVRVRFRRKARQKDLAAEVLEELRKRPDFDQRWENVLTRGRPEEKAQLILRETGMKYAERIDVTSDPGAFALFRRQVLPLMNKTCARSGCHAGTGARRFRFPVGSTTSDTYVYTSFVLLDQMTTVHGPLVDRGDPEGSVLLSYLLPQQDNPRAHPPVGRGPNFRPAFRQGKQDPHYRKIVDWINFLHYPRPEYGLEYENIYPGPFERADVDADQLPGDDPNTPRDGTD